MITLSYVSAACTITVALIIVAAICLLFFGWGYQGGRRSERGALAGAEARRVANVTVNMRRSETIAAPPAVPIVRVSPRLPYAGRDRFRRHIVRPLVRVGRRYAAR